MGEMPQRNAAQIELDDTVWAAKRLQSAWPLIWEIHLFGSVARHHQGNDVDLVLVAGKEYETRFLQALKRFGRGGYYYDTWEAREAAAVEALMIPLEIWNGIEQLIAPFRFDLFVFGANWKQRLDELQRCLPQKDPYFMRNIAHDAILIA